MKVTEIIDYLKAGAYPIENTCDTVKHGDPHKEIHRLGVTMVPTVDVLREAQEWGADMLVVHEPLYYDHMDVVSNTPSPVVAAKKALVEQSDMVIFRYHDHMHRRPVDMIDAGEFYYLGLTGETKRDEATKTDIFTCDTPLTAVELAKLFEEKLGVKHVRIAGERNVRSTRFAPMFGASSSKADLFANEDIEILITGEICEWKFAEYARDAAALGINKSVVVLGHVGSERDGMRYLYEKMKADLPTLEIKYFETAEVYTYTDSN